MLLLITFYDISGIKSDFNAVFPGDKAKLLSLSVFGGFSVDGFLLDSASHLKIARDVQDHQSSQSGEEA